MRDEEFRHEALLYAGEDQFLERTVPFLTEGVEAGEPALVVLNADRLRALRAALNGHAEGIHFADMAAVGANPACIIPAWREFVDEHSDPAGACGESASRSGPTARPRSWWSASATNRCSTSPSPTPRSFHLICPYDTEALDPAVIEEAQLQPPHRGGWSRAPRRAPLP